MPQDKSRGPQDLMPEDQKIAREHSAALGQVWQALTGRNPAEIMSQITATVLAAGGTRPPWQWSLKGEDYTAMAWPQDQPIRACVLLSGPEGEKMRPLTIVPLLEGLPNDLCVEEVFPLPEGAGADVGVLMQEGKNPMWFFDPFYTRDKDDLTPGITHTFWLAGLALGFRRALLDEITLTDGPDYELYAQDWLSKHPDKKSIDVPPLKIDIKGKRFIMPGRFYGEYQIRAEVEEIEEWSFDKTAIHVFYLSFPFDDRPPLRLPLYVSQYTLGNAKIEKGQDIEAYIWLEGRVIDLEASPEPGRE